MQGVVRVCRVVVDVRLMYALCGVLLSVAAHEIFHIIVHFDSFQGVHFLPSLLVLVEVNVAGAAVYTWEEPAAYAITALILFVTLHDVYAIHDSRTATSAKQVLAPDDELSDVALYEMAVKAKIIS